MTEMTSDRPWAAPFLSINPNSEYEITFSNKFDNILTELYFLLSKINK
jgi:hypothetical protein